MCIVVSPHAVNDPGLTALSEIAVDEASVAYNNGISTIWQSAPQPMGVRE